MDLTIIEVGKVTDTALYNIRTTWEDFALKLTTRAETVEDEATYHAIDKSQQFALKSSYGGYVGGRFPTDQKAYRRKAANIAFRSLITLDFDCHTDFDPHCVYVRHTTHSHTPEHPRWRYVIPLSREVPACQYEALARFVARDVIDQVDTTCFDVAHLMFYPSTPSDGEFISEVSKYTNFLDPSLILDGSFLDSPSKWAFSKKDQDLKQLYTKMENPLSKGGIVGAWCKVYDCYDVLAMFPSLYLPSPTRRNRYTYAGSQGKEGAVVYDGGLFFYSNHGTDPIREKEYNAYDLFRVLKFGHLDADAAPTTRNDRLPSCRAMFKYALKDKAVRKEYDADRLEVARETFGAVATDSTEDVLVSLDINEKTGAVLNSLANLLKIVRDDRNLEGLRFELFTRHIITTTKVPWDRIEGVWDDMDDASLNRYLELTYGYKIEQAKLFRQLPSILVDLGRTCHVVRDYITSTEWDGRPRVDTLFVDALMAKDTPLTRSVTRKVLIAAVKRAFEPGCKFDYMTILVSEQGIGKSTLLRLLGGQWYSDSFDFRLDGKNQMEQLRGVWIVESPELKGLSKADINSTKAFLSKTSDRYRGAYEAHTSEFPRQCVFFGSTNEPAFLRDDTGNRRFWIVPCLQSANTLTPLMKELTTGNGDYIRQVWAETYTYYKTGQPIILTSEEEEEMDEYRHEFEFENPFEEEMKRYLDYPIPDGWETLTKEDRQRYMMYKRGYPVSGNFPMPAFVGLNKRMTVTGEEARNEWFAYMPNAKNVTATTCTKMLAKVGGWHRADGKRRFGDYGNQRYFERDTAPATALAGAPTIAPTTAPELKSTKC